MAEAEKVSVLFVCLGNICRSTMAEGVFQSLSKSSSQIGKIDSAGTGAYHILCPPNPKTMAVLNRKGINDYVHRARQVTAQDFNDFDYIFAMDADNLRDLQELQRRVERKGGDSRARVMLFGEYGNGRKEEVEDPYGGPDTGFDAVYEQVERFSNNFLTYTTKKDEPRQVLDPYRA